VAFDVCDHQIRQIVIRAAQEIRKAKGLLEEKNVTVLFNEAAPLLGVIITSISSKTAFKLPAPHEMIDEKTGKFIIPKKDCPKCGEKECMNLFPLCISCKDAEGGKYKSKWECSKCSHQEISEKAFVQWLDELEIDFQPGMKADMGIKTATDKGLE